MIDKRFFPTRAVLLIQLLIISGLIIACGGDAGNVANNENAGEDSPPPPSPTPQPINIDLDGTAGVLAWVGEGRLPGQQSSDAPGELVLIERNGDVTPVFTLPSGTNRIYACGEQATSTDQRYFALYVGTDHGSLFIADQAETLFEIDRIDALGCIGSGALQFSPNGERIAYIDFADNAQTDPVAQGIMYVRESNSRDTEEVLFSFDNVAAFDIADTQVAYVGIFSDYNEAALTIWDDGDTDEVGTFFSEQGCRFAGAQVSLMANNGVSILLGQRCESGAGTRWAIYAGDIAGGGVTRVLNGNATGSFFSESRTATLFASHEGEVMVYAIPNGIARNLVNLRMTTLTESDAGEDITESAVMPRLTSRLYNPEDNALPVVSPDGRWVAMVSNTVNNDVAINIFDLVNPDNPPLILNPVNRGDTISSIGYTPDSATLLFVAGGSNGDNNSLFGVSLEDGVDERLIRGRYGHVIAAATGDFAILTEWRVLTDPREPSYLNLITMDLNDPDTTEVLFEGADIVNDSVTSQRFIYPLAWRETFPEEE